MKIVILGAGRVGATLAEHLSFEANDITIIDTDPQSLSVIQERCDVQAVVGNGAHPKILEAAGILDADMLIAVSNYDEVNMLACQIAYSLFNTPTKIARIRSRAYTSEGKRLFCNEALPIDVVISPELIVTKMIYRLIHYPGALQVLDFAQDKLLLIAIRVENKSEIANCQIKKLTTLLPNTEIRITAVYRQGERHTPLGDTVLEVGDEIFFLAAQATAKRAVKIFQASTRPYKRIMLAGGGHIGSGLAHSLEREFYVKLIEHNVSRTQLIANLLEKTVVLEGDASDKALLLDENIEECDVFCALTNNDEANIMSALQAKKLGVRKVMSLINNTAYVDLISSENIDVIISPQQATLSSLLSHVRKADIVQVHTLRHQETEAIEVIAHGNNETSKVVGKQIDDIPWPDGVTVGAIVREEEVIIAHHDTCIQEDDHVILFLPNRSNIPDVERLFQVELKFF